MTAAPLALDVGVQARPAASPIRYRPEIDGLRAIAVAGVVLFHAFPGILRGGFVGVDVFFVISGYLISRIILAERAESRFSFARFYERRIRRLLPSLILVLAATSLVGLIVLPPDDLKIFARSLGPSAAFFANFHFWTRGSYFQPVQDVRPLLHLWSLGVEEQFYIVWPIALGLLAGRRSRMLLGVLAVLVLASLVADQFTLQRDALAAFYSTPLRAWEPLIGAMFATGPVQRLGGPMLRKAAGLLGLVLIAASMVLLRETTPFPGLAALPACLGAGLVLHSNGAGGVFSAGRWLSLPALVFVGQISYALYLWHWPVLTFLRLGWVGDAPVAWRAGGVALSIGLAALTTFFVETRFRHIRPGQLRRRSLFAFAFGLLVGVAVIGAALNADNGLKGRLSGEAKLAYAAQQDHSHFWSPCFAARYPSEAACTFGAVRPGDPNVLVWGDSTAAAWAPAVEDWATARGLKGRLTSLASCPTALGLDSYDADGRRSACRERNLAALDLATRSKTVRTVVLISRWPMYETGAGTTDLNWGKLSRPGEAVDPKRNPALLAAGLDQLLSELSTRRPDLKIVVFAPGPEFWVDPDRCTQRALMNGRPSAPCVTVDRARTAARQAGSRAILREAMRRHPNVVLVEPDTLFCDARACRAVVGGKYAFSDAVHVSASGAHALGPALLSRMPELR